MALRETLEWIAQVVHTDGIHWELIVVDNGSKDGTRSVVQLFRGRLPVRYVLEPRPGLSAARNRALSEARADCLVFTDDDVRPQADWLTSALEAFSRHPSASVLGGEVSPAFVVPPDRDLLAVFPAVLNGFCGLDHGSEERVLLNGEVTYGANFAIRRSRSFGCTFDENLGNRGGSQRGGEETEFQARIRAAGGHVVWVPSLKVKHVVYPERLTLRYLKRFTVDRLLRSEAPWFEMSGRRLARVPVWLLRRLVSAYVSATIATLSGRRRAAYVARRQAWELLAAAKIARRSGAST